MTIQGKRIIAEPGKIFVRKDYGIVYGNVLELGETLMIDGTPRPETPEDYQEIDDPNVEIGCIL